MPTTRLTRSAPFAHRLAHRYCVAGWRRRTAAWRLADHWSAPTCSVVQVAGGELKVDRRFPLDRDIYRGLFEVIELDLVAPLIWRGDACIDVGANIGLYSVLFAARSVSGRVIAFEPSPTFSRLQENLRPFSNATAINLALGASTERLRLHRTYGDHQTSLREATDQDHEVEVRRLDDIPDVQALAQVDFLKIDVEGWESEVMAGARRLWNEQKVGIALIEANRAWGSVDYLDAVERLGYRCFEVRLRRAAMRLRHAVRLQPLNLDEMPAHINVLIVRPDRLHRVRARMG